MQNQTLEQRVARLETEMQTLRDELSGARRNHRGDWRSMVGAFTDDPGMQEIFKEAMRLREADRRKARRKPAKAAGHSPPILGGVGVFANELLKNLQRPSIVVFSLLNSAGTVMNACKEQITGCEFAATAWNGRRRGQSRPAG